ncbi:sporulation integral membrane protein YlbJ [Acetonema longum]|uniref:Sporulation integral membrane protein YlbJ n=1 Tax=Acetonema longum DSM 6540 TaxID=1009370 RepID=F7NFL8_9FIRM|nr:sporulation integral membrane protein YlbJ [Acetonema longum]EGO65141.1 sporulation integral membrane protein YlbJ [Acetonema longum DSM 6540]
MIKKTIRSRQYYGQLGVVLVALCAICLTVATVKYPKDAFDSAIIGLQLWWTVVFPALLPFFILSEILMGLGIVHFVGILLEPLMRPLFNVPGAGAFALSMGLASGYPMDAVITAKFRKSGMCTAVEAERLLSFTNTADPLFMFGAVAVGMFGRPDLGVIIALGHYLSSFLVGILFRFHGRSEKSSPDEAKRPLKNIFLRALEALFKARHDDGRPIGQLLGDSVKNSMNTILLIGGFIIIFSVVIRILTVTGFTGLLSQAFAGLLELIGYSASLAPALVSGLLEIDLGCLAASQAQAPLGEKVAAAAAIIAWSGLSVHGQVASIVIESGIRIGPYMISRLLHAVLAAIVTVLLMGPASSIAKFAALPVMAAPARQAPFAIGIARAEQTLYLACIMISILTVLSMSYYLIRKLYLYAKR